MNYAGNILVTGAGGYIGRHVVKVLLDNNVNVTAADIRTDLVDPRAKRINCDIFSGKSGLFEELGKPDVCLHLAWQDGFFHNSLAHIKNLSAHFEFLSNMIEEGLRQLAVMGTMHEIGYFEGAINEDTPTNPLSLYGVAKNALRQSLTLFMSKRDVVFQWLRGYYIYGDDIHNHSVFTKILECEEKGQKFFPLTTGENKCDYISVDELAKQISAVITQQEVTGVINCCSGVPRPLKDIVNDFILRNHLSIQVDYGAYPLRPYDSPAIWGDNTKIMKIMKNTSLL